MARFPHNPCNSTNDCGAEDTIIVAVCFSISAAFVCLSIITHDELTRLKRSIICCAITIGTCLMVFYFRSVNLERELSQNTGVLYPSYDEPPKTECNIPNNSLVIYFGKSAAVAWATRFPHTIIKINGDPLLTINKENDIINIVILKIFDESGKIATRVEGNKLWIAPNLRKERLDRSTLEIFDERDRRILFLEILK